MSLNTIRWDIDILALSSIVHREDYTTAGTDTLAPFRTEKVLSQDGTPQPPVPTVSGSSFRGVLRRIGEELTAEVLDYENASLPIPAAHLLTNGGRLAKSAAPFTDEDERHLKSLIPQIAVFGGNASGRIMSGLLRVEKVDPEVAELAHLLRRKPQSATLPSIQTLSEESFTHLADHRPNANHPPRTDADEKTSPLGRFSVETLPAGTRLQTSATIIYATDFQTAFLRDVLTTFATSGHLGGRIAAGHGRITATITPDVKRGRLPRKTVDWRAELKTRRDQALAALCKIT
ncbi:RAMP superfamily CRISPR-associated protein [Mycobacterium intracellulare]|uniref:RAMP superfamily CRISPR-associated protein n=1 Tax=Mycobacterium intracellulare TaxID=1767 RepID=UPI001EEE2DA5|nr:RAMP superfamily CRISPR-associated protein [Mycobacterium intracellulare]MEE3755367.1 RAMP superfamily CRISPR-associated protein [Mycobacterium intracellulare]